MIPASLPGSGERPSRDATGVSGARRNRRRTRRRRLPSGHPAAVSGKDSIMHLDPTRAAAAFAALLLSLSAGARAATVDFEDLGANLPIDGNDFYDGRSAFDPADQHASDFSSQGATFHNDFDDFGGGCCWQGWAYSQTMDTTTSGPGNQYSAFPGSGVDGSATYGVAYTGGVEGTTATRISFAQERSITGGWFTNTTWAALSMLNGDSFAKQFGGASGSDPDFFSLTISGFDAGGAPTGAVEFLLADYRFGDDALDYVIDEWTWVDLSALGAVKDVDFSIASSDTAFGYVNTPAYFAMDGLMIVPEPASGALLALGLIGLGVTARKTR